MAKQPRIHPRLVECLPDRTEEETKFLEERILADGEIREPIEIWKGMVVDGHGRFDVARKHKMPYPTRELEFGDEDEALAYAIHKQLARRNVSDESASELRGRYYKLKGGESGRPTKLGHRGHIILDQSKNSKPDGGDSADDIAEELGVSTRTLRRDKKKVDLKDSLTESLRRSLGGKKVTEGQLELMAALTPEQQGQVALLIRKHAHPIDLALSKASGKKRKRKKNQEESAPEPEEPDPKKVAATKLGGMIKCLQNSVKTADEIKSNIGTKGKWDTFFTAMQSAGVALGEIRRGK